MTGGLFGYPFVPNMKCVWFTTIMASGYWFLPPQNYAVLVALLILPYVAMSWYDEAYACSNKLKPTLIPFGRTLFLPLKPPAYKAEFASLPPEAIRVMDNVDHIFAWICLVVIGTWMALHFR